MERLTFDSIHPDSMSQSEPMTERARRIRAYCPLFRILVIGRANAGKTTILQKVCNTTDEPEIHNSDGEKVRNQ
jgi:GTPase SAR1 family protein